MRSVQYVKIAFAAVSSILILGGLCLLIWPGASMATICILWGIISIIYGIVRLIGYFSHDLYLLAFQFDMAVGILAITIGCILIFPPADIVSFLPTVIGVFILVDSALRIQTAIDAKHFGMKKWWAILLISIGGTALSVLLLLHPVRGGAFLIRLVGAASIIDGVENLLACLYTIKVPRRAAADLVDADYP